MKQRGDRVPQFEATTVGGERVSYSSIWQQKHLLLVILPAAVDEQPFVDDVNAAAARYGDTACVVTRDAIGGVTGPAAIVADKWGEVVYATTAASVSELPSPEDLFDWIEYLRSQCPECEGESK